MTANVDHNRRMRAWAGVVSLIAALVLGLHIGETLSRHPDRSVIAELWRMGRYFTILTTLLIALSFARIALVGRVSASWATALAYWSAIVGIVYHVLLARDLNGLGWWTDQGLHTLVPITVVLWWLRLSPKPGLRPRDAVIWLSWPGIYMAYALIRGEIDGLHPYFFLDPPLIGWPRVLLWCVGMGLVFWLVGLGIVHVTRRIIPAPLPPEGDDRRDLQPR